MNGESYQMTYRGHIDGNNPGNYVWNSADIPIGGNTTVYLQMECNEGGFYMIGWSCTTAGQQPYPFYEASATSVDCDPFEVVFSDFTSSVAEFCIAECTTTGMTITIVP